MRLTDEEPELLLRCQSWGSPIKSGNSYVWGFSLSKGVPKGIRAGRIVTAPRRYHVDFIAALWVLRLGATNLWSQAILARTIRQSHLSLSCMAGDKFNYVFLARTEQSQPQGSSISLKGESVGVCKGGVSTPSLKREHLAGTGFVQLNLHPTASANEKKESLIRLLWWWWVYCS